MGILLVISRLVYRKPDSISIIAISLLIILILNPFAINDIGLQLSYGGTIGIILFNKHIIKFFERIIDNIINNKNSKLKKAIKKISEILSVTISAQIIIFPITLIHFNTISLSFAISNIPVSFIMGAIMLLGFFCIFVSYILMPIAKFIGMFLNILLEILKFIANFVSNIPLTNFLVISPPKFLIFVYYLSIILFYLYIQISRRDYIYLNNFQKRILHIVRENKKKIFKIFFLLTISIILITFIYIVIPKDLRIYFIDVGQRR